MQQSFLSIVFTFKMKQKEKPPGTFVCPLICAWLQQYPAGYHDFTRVAPSDRQGISPGLLKNALRCWEYQNQGWQEGHLELLCYHPLCRLEGKLHFKRSEQQRQLYPCAESYQEEQSRTGCPPQ